MAASTALPPARIAARPASTARWSAAAIMARPDSRHSPLAGVDGDTCGAVHAASPVEARPSASRLASRVERMSTAPCCAACAAPSYRAYTVLRGRQLNRAVRPKNVRKRLVTARPGALNLITDVGGL